MSCNPTTGNDFGVFYSQQDICGQLNDSPVFEKADDRTGGKPEDVTNFEVSNRVKTNKQAKKQVKVGKAYEASIEFELTPKTAKLLENAFYNSYTTFIDYTASTIEVDSVLNKITDSANGFTDIQSGQWIFISGSSTGAVNQSYYVTNKVSDGELDIHIGQIVFGSTGETLTVKGTTLRTGSENKYLTTQKRVRNATSPEDATSYVTFYDGLIGSLSLTVPPSGIMTGSISITHKNRLPGTGKIFDQSDSAVTEYDVGSSCDGLDNDIYIGFDKTETAFTEFGLELNWNLSSIDKAGKCGPGVIDSTTLSASGALNAISFEDNPLVEIIAYEDGTRRSVTCPIKFPDGKRMYITIRQFLYTENTQNDGGDEVTQSSGTYAAEEDSFGTTVQVDLDFDPSAL